MYEGGSLNESPSNRGFSSLKTANNLDDFGVPPFFETSTDGQSYIEQSAKSVVVPLNLFFGFTPVTLGEPS